MRPLVEVAAALEAGPAEAVRRHHMMEGCCWQFLNSAKEGQENEGCRIAQSSHVDHGGPESEFFSAHN